MKRVINKALLGILALVFSSQGLHAQKETFQPTLKMEGRIMYDFNFLSAGDDYDFAGSEFRRLRWATKGKITEKIGYSVDFELASATLSFRDIYISYTLSAKSGTFSLGSVSEPTSLNNMTSSKYITFFERAMLANTQPSKYGGGIMYNNQQLFKGKVGLQLAYTSNGDETAGFRDKSIKGGANFTARLTSAVLNNKEKHQVVHLGINYEHRKNDSDDYSYKIRVENHMGDKYTVSALDTGTFVNTQDIGFELATTFGALSLQAEYELSAIVSSIDTYKASAYYAFVSYFLTGEHRPYKNSSFGRVKPQKDVGVKNGGLGAIELVARYSVMDFSNYPDAKNKNKIANITVGMNWYLNNRTRIMYNFTHADFNDLKVYGDDNLQGHLLRFQIDF